MERRYVAIACLGVSLAFRIYACIHGHTPQRSFLVEPFVIGWVAFLLPTMVPVVLIEKYVLHFEPWIDGHNVTTVFNTMTTAALFWCFPVARVERWLGCFNAFHETKRRRGMFTRGAAYAIDAVNKRLFGRQKTGGWA